jgi:hypothetical protein
MAKRKSAEPSADAPGGEPEPAQPDTSGPPSAAGEHDPAAGGYIATDSHFRPRESFAERVAKKEDKPASPAQSDITERAMQRRAEIKMLASGFLDPVNGVRICEEAEVAPGEIRRRVRIEFDKKPSAEERAIVKKEGFRWAADVEAWAMEASPKARELAKKAVNLVYKHRGADHAPVMTPMGSRF